MAQHPAVIKAQALVHSGDIAAAESALSALVETEGDHALVAVLDELPPKDLIAILREYDAARPSVISLVVTPAQFAEAVNSRLDHRKKMALYRGPVLVMHTRFDDLVPVTHGERLAEWAAGPVTTRIFERGHHNTILAENEAEYFAAIAAFVKPLHGP